MARLGSLSSRSLTGAGLKMLARPWDLTQASYTNKSINVSAQDGWPAGLSFKKDGTAMYIAGKNNSTVYQYTLSTAWDISTATYASKSVSVGTQISQVNSLDFSSDGTKMFVAGWGSTIMYQYTLSTAWDVSTATYANKSFNYSSAGATASGMRFRTNGTSFYINGANDTIYQFTLGSQWDISTASYANKSKSVAYGGDLNPTGIDFKYDGTIMFVIDTSAANNRRVTPWVMSTPWDISTATASANTTTVGAQDTNSYDFCMRYDGMAFFVVGPSVDTVFQYKISEDVQPSYNYSVALAADPSFTGRMIGLGADATSYLGNLIPTYAANSISTWTSATTTPSTFLGANANNWAWNTSSTSTGSTAMIVNGYSGHTATTTDGITWTARGRLSPNSSSLIWNSIATNGTGTWVAIYGNGGNSTTASYSTNNGDTWTNVTVPSGRWAQVVYGGGRFVCIDIFSPASTMYSTDGITWTAGGSAGLGLPSATYSNAFFYAGGSINKFMMIRESNTDLVSVSSSTNGVTWTVITATATGASIFRQPLSAYGNGRIVMIMPYTNIVWYSTDAGATWSIVSNPFTTGYLIFSSLRYFNGVFIALAKTGSGQTAATYISPDGVSWTIGTAPTGIANGTGDVTYVST